MNQRRVSESRPVTMLRLEKRFFVAAYRLIPQRCKIFDNRIPICRLLSEDAEKPSLARQMPQPVVTVEGLTFLGLQTRIDPPRWPNHSHHQCQRMDQRASVSYRPVILLIRRLSLMYKE